MEGSLMEGGAQSKRPVVDLTYEYCPIELQSFTKYSDLQMEIKLRIWEYSIQRLPGRMIPMTFLLKTHGRLPQPHYPLVYKDAAFKDVFHKDYRLFQRKAQQSFITTNLENDTLLFLGFPDLSIHKSYAL
jgi:hypothetical protein